MLKIIFKIFEIKTVIYLVFISLFLGLLEIFTFTIIPPALYLAIDPIGFNQNFGEYVQFIGNNNYLGIIISVFLVSCFVFKYVILRVFTKIQFRILSKKQQKITSTIYYGFLNEDYNFFNLNSSGHLVKILNNDSGDFRRFSNTLINLFTELCIGLSILVVLFWQNWYLTLFLLSIVGIGGWIFEIRKRGHIKRFSTQRNNVQKDIFKLLNSTFYGIREIKITKTESFFSKIFDNNIHNFYQLNDTVEVESVNSRSAIELTFVVFLSVLVFSSTILIHSSSLPGFSLLLFLIASLRLLPTLNRVTGSLVLLKAFNVTVFNLLICYEKYSNLKINKQRLNHSKECSSILITDLTFKYPGKEKNVFTNITTELGKGDVVGIRGNSGSGKSTFVNVLINLLQPLNGKVDFFDLNGNSLNVDDCSFSYLAQETIILDTNLRDNVAFGVQESKILDSEIIEALRLAKLDGLLKEMNIYEPLGERGLTLSGGQRQRLSIARMFFRRGDIIILDEITSGLDKKTETEIFQNILENNKNKIIIIISHSPDIWSLCNKFIYL